MVKKSDNNRQNQCLCPGTMSLYGTGLPANAMILSMKEPSELFLAQNVLIPTINLQTQFLLPT